MATLAMAVATVGIAADVGHREQHWFRVGDYTIAVLVGKPGSGLGFGLGFGFGFGLGLGSGLGR